MHFPLESPIFQFFFWLVDSPGVGSLAVGLIIVVWVSAAGGAFRWIAHGAQADEPETYAYPTPALHEH